MSAHHASMSGLQLSERASRLLVAMGQLDRIRKKHQAEFDAICDELHLRSLDWETKLATSCWSPEADAVSEGKSGT